MLSEHDWFRPFESFDLDQITRNLRIIRRGEQLTGIKQPEEVVRERLLPRYIIHGFTVSFDFPYLAESDINRSHDERKIYYPIRVPTQEELVKREIGPVNARQTVTAVEGFGNFGCLITHINEGMVLKIDGKKIYPYAMLVKTPAGVFYSLDSADKDEEDGFYSTLHRLWKPYESDDSAGYIYVPVELPSLKLLEFRLLRMDPRKIYEELYIFS